MDVIDPNQSEEAPATEREAPPEYEHFGQQGYAMPTYGAGGVGEARPVDATPDTVRVRVDAGPVPPAAATNPILRAVEREHADAADGRPRDALREASHDLKMELDWARDRAAAIARRLRAFARGLMRPGGRGRVG